jgi:hypothetical protein
MTTMGPASLNSPLKSLRDGRKCRRAVMVVPCRGGAMIASLCRAADH